MKKTLYFLFVAMSMMSTSFAGGGKPLPDELNAEVKSIITLKDANQEVIKSLLDGTHSDVAIECEKGTMLPVKYLGNFKFLSLNCDPNLSVKLEETTYLRFIKKQVYMSRDRDLKNWEKANKFFKKMKLNVGVNELKSHILVESNSVVEESPLEDDFN
ncbi:MAG: hypothetical protein HKM07_06090 [Chlamydiae bacterium]|nr:hypothetical protein [Chlamydiota bacterium]